MKNPKTVFVAGVFNVLHPGHLRLFRFARELGERLVVGVHSDSLVGVEPHVPQELRLEVVRANSYVDEVLLIDRSVESAVEQLRPDFVVKGKEHENLPNPELEVLRKYGGKLVFSSGEAVFSSIDLINRDFTGSDRIVTHPPNDFLARHEINPIELVSTVNKFPNLQVCVIGDLIVDEYLTCDPLGMSQEDPTIVVTPVDTQRFLGGSGIVAAHAAGLGARVHYLSVAGDDEIRQYAVEELESCGVTADVLRDDTRPPTLKQRFRADGTTLLRVSHLHQASIDLGLQNQVFERFEQIVSECQLLVFSDFNYGCLPQALVERLVECARAAGLIMAADSQCSSQIGDVSRFNGMDLLMPTEHEARVSLRNHQDGLVVLAEQLRTVSEAKNIILTLGAEGSLLHVHGEDGLLHTDRIPQLNSAPRDVIGAGDSHLITSAMAMSVGATGWEAAYLGAVAAAIQINRIGNVPITQSELINELK